MVNRLINENNELRHVFDNGDFDKSDLAGLENQSINDMRISQREKLKCITDKDDFGQVIEFIYQLRCNVFHGAKSPYNKKDVALVASAGRFLKEWINSAFSSLEYGKHTYSLRRTKLV